MDAVTNGGKTDFYEFQRGLNDSMGNRAPAMAQSPKGKGSRGRRQTSDPREAAVEAGQNGFFSYGGTPRYDFSPEAKKSYPHPPAVAAG
jgi:hypothetical protein